MAAVKLERLIMKEISGVDDPANEIPGWMVAKAAGADDTSIVGKLFKALSAGKDDIDMTMDELNAELDTRFAAFTEELTKAVGQTVSEALAKSAVEETPAGETATAPVATAAPIEAAPVATPAIDADTVAKAIEAGIEKAMTPVIDALDAVIDRTAALEKGTVLRKSLDGQEGGGDETPAEPTLKDAIGAVLKGAKVTLT